MEKENTHVGDELDDWNNVKVVVSVTSLGVLLLTKEFVGHADENTKLDVKFEINENQEVVEGIVRQRGQLLAALGNARSAHLAGQHLDLREIDAAIAAVEPPADHTVERTEMVAEDDGWIAWKGGECPVDGAARVEVKYADGMPGHEIAGSLRWSWIFDGANGGDIIAYRVVQEGDA